MRDDFLLPEEYVTLHATIEDALSHRTGMPRHDLSYVGRNLTLQDLVRTLRYLPITAEIRTRWQYCNMMYMTISHFIETWSGMWLGDFLRTRIYEPLNMTNTFFSLSDAQEAHSSSEVIVATPYYWKNRTQEYRALPLTDPRQEYVKIQIFCLFLLLMASPRC